MASASCSHHKMVMTFLPSQSGQPQTSDLRRTRRLPSSAWGHSALCGKHFILRTRANCHCNNSSRAQDETYHETKSLLKKNRYKKSVFLTLWPARFGLGHLWPTAEEKWLGKRLCLSTFVDGAEYFAGHGNRKNTPQREPSLKPFSCKAAKKKYSSDLGHWMQCLEWSCQHCIFLITQEDRKLIWRRNKVILQGTKLRASWHFGIKPWVNNIKVEWHYFEKPSLELLLSCSSHLRSLPTSVYPAYEINLPKILLSYPCFAHESIVAANNLSQRVSAL